MALILLRLFFFCGIKKRLKVLTWKKRGRHYFKMLGAHARVLIPPSSNWTL
jgi:hypothetical protein